MHAASGDVVLHRVKTYYFGALAYICAFSLAEMSCSSLRLLNNSIYIINLKLY